MCGCKSKCGHNKKFPKTNATSIVIIIGIGLEVDGNSIFVGRLLLERSGFFAKIAWLVHIHDDIVLIRVDELIAAFGIRVFLM